MANLFEPNYAESGVSSLMASGENARATGIAVAAGEGDLKRGAILVRDADMTYKAAAASDVTATAYVAVLDEDVSTGTDNTQSAQSARAWQSGIFMADRLHLKADAAMTAAVETVLRAQGILIKSWQKADGTPSSTITEATHSTGT